MFVDFNKVFKDKPQTKITVPKSFIDYMSKSLPEGVKYIVDENGNCKISSETGSFTVGGFLFEPTEEQRKILGENFTQQDVFNYFYNAQKTIPLTLEKEGIILLNGAEFPIEKIAFNPMMPIKCNEKNLCFHPSKFPEAVPIKLGCDKYEREVHILRVPNESVNTMAFESNKEEPLKVQFFINKNEKKMTLNLSLNLIKASTVLDLVQATSIYNAFVEGKGTLFGKVLDDRLVEDGAKKFDEKSIAFWERVLDIERALEVQFYPPQDNVVAEDIYLVEQLYQSLVNMLPTRDNTRIDSVNGKWNAESLGWDINEMLGKPIFFKFECVTHIDLFGVKKELPTLVGVVNAVLGEYKIKGKKQKVTFVDESQEKKRFNAIMYFKSEDELLKFTNGEHQAIIEMFQNAKKPHECLKI